MDDTGDTAVAAAMSALIVFTSIGGRILYWFLTQGLQKRTQAWLQR
jgi:iron(III) transport system permease protein